MAKGQELNLKAISISFGITWGLFIAFLGIIANFGWATQVVALLSDYYIGFSTSGLGIILGFIEGFICAAIGGAIFVWLYNYLLKKL